MRAGFAKHGTVLQYIFPEVDSVVNVLRDGHGPDAFVYNEAVLERKLPLHVQKKPSASM